VAYGVKTTAQWRRRFEFRFAVECMVYAQWRLEEAGYRVRVGRIIEGAPVRMDEPEPTGGERGWWIEPVDGGIDSLTEADSSEIAHQVADLIYEVPHLKGILDSGGRFEGELGDWLREVMGKAYDLYQEERTSEGFLEDTDASEEF
jgi:hypothetical protein